MYRLSFIGFMGLFLSACVTVQTGPTQNEKASKINVQLGIGYYYQNNLEMANEKLLKALSQDPESSQAHYAYAVLQNRFLDKEKTEHHFRKAIELDPKNSEALSNFGAYLCNDGRMEESEKLFMQAVKNPLYKSPEVAYTNAAVCLLKSENPPTEKATGYLKKALAARNNYTPALIKLAELSFDDRNFDLTQLYLDRFHLVTQPTSLSLWLDIRNALEKGNSDRADELAERLKNDFADSTEYQSWLSLQNE
jgi:type IV pilus assembly protein PilF